MSRLIHYTFIITVLCISSIAISCQQPAAGDEITVEQLSEYMDHYTLVDVRTPEEIAEGKIEGSLEIDYYDDNFEFEIKKLDRDKKYIIYCRSGGRSAQAQDFMKQNGFTNVINLAGGYLAYSGED